MGETLQKWIIEWQSGRTNRLPDWIPIDEIMEWKEFERLHPELTVHDAETLAAYQKLGEDLKNSRQKCMSDSLSSDTVNKALNSIRSASIRTGNLQFTALWHHMNKAMLTHAFFKLKKDAAPGCDAITWEEYAKGLDHNIEDLWERLINWSYFPKPVRRTYIPKTSGCMRPLGISAVEDKIVQYALKMILENIYDPSFKGMSYGFRPGTRAHDALDALYVAITTKNVNYILDADIVGCFDNINKQLLLEILKDRIGDKRILRLIERLLNAGILDDGELRILDDGVVQGSTLSPLLANILLDYILDNFIIWWRSIFAKGEVYYVRYADDYVIAFQYKEDAEKLLQALTDRLLCAGLRLNAKKTRLIPFCKYTRIFNGDTETFDFLGFTHNVVFLGKDANLSWFGIVSLKGLPRNYLLSEKR